MQESLQLRSQDEEIKKQMSRLRCPSCSKHTVLWLLPNTQIKNLPIKCKRCSYECIIDLALTSDT